MIEELRKISATLGANPLLVQAAGGNTSLKHDGVMWIKASGTWLADAMTKDIFVPLDLETLQEGLMRDDPACESCTGFVRNDLNTSGLRPSIETSVHGLMKQSVVLHVHCVNTIAWAIQVEGEQRLSALLKGLPWAFVPYARPGLQLSRAIRSVIKSDTCVLILQNHGLVVSGETVASAESLLNDVVGRLHRSVRTTAKPDLVSLAALADHSTYRLPSDPGCHGFAMEARSHHRGSTEVFYPDHAVFLGTMIPDNPLSAAPALAVAGQGVLVHRQAKPSIEPMLRCLTEVFLRLDGSELLKALTPQEIGELLNWDAEKYRQSLKV